ncbi:MAG: O-acetylhomoserine aminocarboxypropyltransferase/cysteine synthase [Fibrobacterales bacterium]
MAYKIETQGLHSGAVIDSTMSRGVPLHRTSSYVFRDSEHAANLFALKELGNIYTRLMNPTQDVLEKRVAEMEGGAAALAVASGMSAIFYTAINICKAGDEIVSGNNLYGGTYSLLANVLPDFGITTNMVKITDLEAVEKAITPKTKMLYTEIIGNPVLDCADIRGLSAIAKKHHIPLVVDSTFTPPYICKPIELGANIVIHSLTKWIGGHGTGIGGIVVDAANFDWTHEKFDLYNKPSKSYHGMKFATELPEPLLPLAFILRMRLVPLRTLGAAIAPDNAWLFLQGLETLHVRMQRHCENATAVAEHLKNHPKVEWVRHPGLKDDPSYKLASEQLKNGYTAMVVFGIKGGRAAGEKFINSLGLISHLANVGDAKSLALHPASTSHSQLSEDEQIASGLTPDLVRLSIGIENIEDILTDIDQALDAE